MGWIAGVVSVPSQTRLVLDDNAYAPVLLHAGARVFETEGTVLPIARRPQVDGGLELLGVRLDVPGPPFAQHEIIEGCSDFIASAFEMDSAVSTPTQRRRRSFVRTGASRPAAAPT